MLGLKKLDYDVHFAHIQQTAGDNAAMEACWGENFYTLPYQKPLTAQKQLSMKFHSRVIRKMQAMTGSDPSFTYGVDDWYDSAVDEALLNLADKIQPDIVMVEYVFFSKALEIFGQHVTKVLDTHDVFADRYKLYLRNGQPPRWYSTTQKEENKGLSRADVVLSIQDQEAKVFKKRLSSNQKVLTVGHLVPLLKLPVKTEAPSLLYVASSNSINVNAIDGFIEQAFPAIRSRFEGARLILAGEICDVVEDFEGCQKLGYVEELKDAYALASVVINPIRFGTGLKIKNVEALAHSKPLVTTAVGAEGLEAGAHRAFRVADTPAEFVREIVSILSDQRLAQSLAEQAYEFVAERNQKCLVALNAALTAKSSAPLLP